MDNELLNIYYNEPHKTNKNILKALYNRGYIENDNLLTEEGRNYVISILPLQEQCKALDIKLNEISLTINEKVESTALNYFNELNYIGTSIEGNAIFTILKCLILDKLSEYNYFNSREDACRRYLEAQLIILQDKSCEIIEYAKIVDRNIYLNNVKEILEDPFSKSILNDFTIEFAEKFYDEIDKKLLITLLSTICGNPYLYRSGWPDLTLVKDNEIKFVEVKSKDKLHDSQIITIQKMKELLPFEFSILKVNRK